MATDWAANVKKYVPDADDGIIAGIVRYCGIALQKRDSSLVSFGDPAETKRVRENFLKKKLALTQSDAKLDAAIAEVGTRMKGEKFRNRVTVYYLLAEQFGKLQMFAKAAKATAATKKSAGTAKAAAGKAAVGLASSGKSASAAKASKAKVAKATGGVVGAAGAVGAAAIGAAGAVATGAVSGAKAVGETAADAVGAVASGARAVGETAVGAAGAAGAAVAGAAGAAAAMLGSAASAAGSGVSGAAQALTGGGADARADDSEGDGSGWSWLIWLLLAALVLGVLWWLFRSKPATSADGGVTTEQSAAATGTQAPAEGTVAIPTGAGVTTETRDGKPVVKVYFDTGKTDVVPAFAAAAGGLKSYLDGHAGTTLAVSGYNDKTGNAAANAALSKRRAEAVKASLVTSGIADATVALVKPTEATDTKVDDAAARRVEVVVQ